MNESKSPRLRPATPADVAPLANLIRVVWPDSPVDPAQIELVLRSAVHATHIAELDGRAVGFVDSFLIPDRPAGPLWQIDLLAVSPSDRGRGLGCRLIEISLLTGRRRQGAVARALIAVDNVPSQKSFSRAGFKTDRRELALHIAAGGNTPPLPPAFTPIPVQTLLYTGIWLEPGAGPVQTSLLPPVASSQISMLRGAEDPPPPAGFLPAGRYHNWFYLF